MSEAWVFITIAQRAIIGDWCVVSQRGGEDSGDVRILAVDWNKKKSDRRDGSSSRKRMKELANSFRFNLTNAQRAALHNASPVAATCSLTVIE